MSPSQFLTRDEVVALHAILIDKFGGAHGLRDPGLFDSALAQPEARFGGQFLHPDLCAMAAAYAFHLIQNHPFFDGNKRIGWAAARLFLEINGLDVVATDAEKYGTAIAVATGKLAKDALADWFRRVTRPLAP